MTNREIDIARSFHNLTKYALVERDGRTEFLMGSAPDFGPTLGEQSRANEPHPFKVYSALDSIELPRDFAPFSMPLLDAIAMSGAEASLSATPSLAALARISLLSNGILKHGGTYGTGRELIYRAAGATGARYHLEMYFVCGDLPDLDAGVYHYAADTHTLGRLRSGDYRAALVEATGGEPATAHAPALLIATSTFWRNAWRYLERAYRHTWWDLGTTLANVLAVATAEGLQSKVVLGFDDAAVNRLLDVNGLREAAVCIVPLGSGSQPGAAPAIEALNHAVEPVSSSEIDFPKIWEMQAASSLASGSEAAEWRDGRMVTPGRTAAAPEVGLRPLPESEIPEIPVDQAIRRRRSTRHYARDEAIPFDTFSTLIERSSRPIAFDCLDPDTRSFTDQYLIVNNVDGLEQGSYALHPDQGTLERLASGDFRDEAARLASEQGYAADAHVNVYYLADLDAIFDAFGNRGYRIAQLEGALRAGKLHLAAHALGLGAVGSTSLDDEVTTFFSPHAATKSFMFIVVYGKRR
jgi:SagB-type dehydrogenase family enzyme